MWQAYLDGELSACESAEFEAGLSETERRMLASDAGFTAKLNQVIDQGECPQDMWGRIRAKAHPSARREAGPILHRNWRVLASAAIAACLLFVLFGNFTLGRKIGDPLFLKAAASVRELESESEVAPGRESVLKYLAERGIRIDMPDDQTIERSIAPHTSFRIIGARQSTYAGEKVTEILTACCDRPVRIVMAPAGSRAAKEIVLASAEPGPVQAIRNLDGLIIGIVSDHPTAGLMNLLQIENSPL